MIRARQCDRLESAERAADGLEAARRLEAWSCWLEMVIRGRDVRRLDVLQLQLHLLLRVQVEVWRMWVRIWERMCAWMCVRMCVWMWVRMWVLVWILVWALVLVVVMIHGRDGRAGGGGGEEGGLVSSFSSFSPTTTTLRLAHCHRDGHLRHRLHVYLLHWLHVNPLRWRWGRAAQDRDASQRVLLGMCALRAALLGALDCLRDLDLQVVVCEVGVLGADFGEGSRFGFLNFFVMARFRVIVQGAASAGEVVVVLHVGGADVAVDFQILGGRVVIGRGGEVETYHCVFLQCEQVILLQPNSLTKGCEHLLLPSA